MGSSTLWSLILILTAFLNCKAVGVGEVPEREVERSPGAATTLLTPPPSTSKAITLPSVETTATPTVNKTTPKTTPTPKPTTHTTSNVTQAPTTPATTPMSTTAYTTTNLTQAPTSPLNTTVHTTAHTTQPTNHTTANSTQAPTEPTNTTAHTANTTAHTANTTAHTTSVPTNHTTANSTVRPTLPSNITTTIPANHTTTAPANLTTHTTANGTHTTTHITYIPTPTYSPKPSPPATGNYSVSEKGANCIMALMGLELVIHAKEDSYFNIAPNETVQSGSCGTSSSNLNITFHGGFINFNFMKDGEYYFIDQIQALLTHVGVRQIIKQTLMKTKLGYSYKCKSMQKFPLEKDLSLVMVNARFQAFNIEHNSFGAESECFQDHSSRIAVAVGITVVAVIILAIILYFIYRKRKLAGYQRI
ncbi:hypothetical protein NDU88_000898 [Pleurodeles waltl]|uniref:Lysosome-associated membrane glycoprotein 2-like luminal domain-containing protein n=1 Tax=Pleurodeles waltl TaxID=8319 RepID=A0AAV7LG10_PLEWA|nr:hypothetical protein NDU88_000898 [Pleurodeles waltl]